MAKTTWIVGSDEAGYGTWAGSLYVAAVAAPEGWDDSMVADSKSLSDAVREAAVIKYMSRFNQDPSLGTPEDPGLHCVLLSATREVIDEHGVWRTLISLHNEAHTRLRFKLKGEAVSHIVDGLVNTRGQLRPWITPMVKADTQIPAVSLASCVAKVAQVRAMKEHAKTYPGYGFSSHRGYGSPEHQAALQRLGVCPIHRRSYSNIKKVLAASEEDSEFLP